MIKILKRMRRREAVMALICAVLVLGQIYFDLTLPDYMTSLTKLINTPGAQTAEILGIGLKMLCCPSPAAILRQGRPPASATPCARTSLTA